MVALASKDFTRFKLTGADASRKGKPSMKITFELTAGGKVINRRIYTPIALQNSLDSWTNPFPKPIQVYHNEDKDPVGRIIEVYWEDTEQEALQALGNNVRAFNEVRNAYATNDAQRIYKAMDKYGLLRNEKWPGLGRVIAVARITSADAIEKFEDETYMTFSAGQFLDSLRCGRCGSEWSAGDICEHSPSPMAGKDSTIMVATALRGKEASIVNSPANNTSIIKDKFLEISGMDNIDDQAFVCDYDLNTVVVYDAQVEFEHVNAGIDWADLESLQFDSLMNLIISDNLDLMKLGKTAENCSPELRHQILETLDNFESLENNVLVFKDHLSAGLQTPENAQVSGDKEMTIEQLQQLLAPLQASLDSLVERISGLETAGQTQARTEDTEEVQTQASEDSVVDSATEETEDNLGDLEDVDWYLLDLALDSEVRNIAADAELSSEKRKALPDSAFCGPNRSFPVPDCAHVTAARRLIGRYKGPGSKDAILACVDRKAKKMGCDDSADQSQNNVCKCKNCRCGDYDSLATDYNEALAQLDSWKSKYEKTLTFFAKKLDKDFQETEDSIEFDKLEEWFDSQSQEPDTTVVEDKILDHPLGDVVQDNVENPVIDSAQNAENKLPENQWERDQIVRIQSIAKDHGADIALLQFQKIRKFFPRDFDIQKYLSNSKE